MTVAASQMQKQNVDVYDDNLWKWPAGTAQYSRSPGDQFVPEMQVWYSAASNGYIGIVSGSNVTFTDRSVTTKYAGGYSAGTFLDLPPGDYTISFESDNPLEFMFMQYIRLADGKVMYGGQNCNYVILDKGKSIVHFNVPDKSLMYMMKVQGVDTSTGRIAATLTDIKIKEGTL